MSNDTPETMVKRDETPVCFRVGFSSFFKMLDGWVNSKPKYDPNQKLGSEVFVDLKR